MARRFVMNADFLQSVPASARERKEPHKAREAAQGMRASASADKPASAPLIARKHYARVIGAATLASLVSFALIASPGEKPADITRVSPSNKNIAQGLNNAHNPIHALTNSETKRKKQNDRKRVF